MSFTVPTFNSVLQTVFAGAVNCVKWCEKGAHIQFNLDLLISH